MDPKMSGNPQVGPHESEPADSNREQVRERNLDKTLADSFPTSDPPSTIPDPVSAHAHDDAQADFDDLIADLPPGSWAVISEDDVRVIGSGATRDEAVQNAGRDQTKGIRVVRVPQDPDAPEQAA